MSSGQATPIYTEVPRFAAGSQESLDHLESEGFVVIKSALSPGEAEHALGLTWDYLEGLGTGIDRSDMSTWAFHHASFCCCHFMGFSDVFSG